MAITTRGSQSREPIEETEYHVVSRYPLTDRGFLILQDDAGKRELWACNDDFAGYVIVVDGCGYEFVRTER